MTDKFTISTDKAKLDIKIITDFLTNRSYLARGRSTKAIEKSISNSLCYGVYKNDDRQVRFARVVKDFSIFAWIMDVFIIEEFRGKGLGKLLMKEIMSHPELQGLLRWGLVTNDVHSLYEKFGFKIISKPDLMM